jgi:DNA-binding Lrp family transcriptional regulator
MGRPITKLDPRLLLDVVQKGIPQKEAAESLGVSIPTLQKRIADITEKQGIILKYRELQNIQLTSIQARILEAITPDKINEAPLRDLVLAFKILKDKELTMTGRPSEIKGLVGYLVEIEKREAAESGAAITPEDMFNAIEISKEVAADPDFDDPEYIPEL